MCKTSEWWEFTPHHSSSVVVVVVVDRPLCDINPPARCIIVRNIQCLATLQSAAMPSYFHRTKALSCQKAPIWSKKKEASLSPPPLHLASPTPSSCCAGLAAKRGFLFWFRCWRSKFPGMWNQRRRCHVSPLPRFSTLPSSLSGIASSSISSSMRSGGAELRHHTACRGPCSIPRMMHEQDAAADDFSQSLRYFSVLAASQSDICVLFTIFCISYGSILLISFRVNKQRVQSAVCSIREYF